MLNLPNCLTISRLILALAITFVLAFDSHGTVAKTIALWAFVLGAITDFFDGYLARKWNQVTNFGKLIDPLADKILVSVAFIYLSVVDICPFWVTVIIMLREFLVTGLRQLAVEQGEVIAADNFGKWKTVMQIVFCIAALLHLAYAGTNNSFFAFLSTSSFAYWVRESSLWLAFALTLISGANYCWKARHLLR